MRRGGGATAAGSYDAFNLSAAFGRIWPPAHNTRGDARPEINVLVACWFHRESLVQIYCFSPACPPHKICFMYSI